MTRADVHVAIAHYADTAPDRLAVKDLDRQLSYAVLADEVAELGNGLVDNGVAHGDRVALHLPNSVDFVVAALACLRVGAVFVPLAISDPVGRKETIIADAAPALVITGDEVSGSPTDVRRDPTRWIRYPDLLDPERATRPVSDPTSNRPAYAIYTSGTTGTPKGVLIGNDAFGSAIRSTIDALGLGPATRTLCVSPFHFDGSFGTLFPTLFSGGAIVLRPREALLFPRTFFNAVKREAVTYTGFSPSYLRLLLSSPQAGQLAATTLEVVALGGEACSAADVHSLWEAAPGVEVFNRYGPTETTIAVTHAKVTPESIADGTVSIGQPHPDVSFYVVDDEGRLVDGPDQVGELYIGGNQVMDGYWGAPALTADVLRTDVVPGETVYRTGDLVYRADGGDYVYVDRADRVIKRLGIRISLIELGEAMRGLAGVSAAACVAFDDDGQTGIVVFVVTDGRTSALDLRRAAGDRLPDSMLPDRVELVDSLPLTRSSKLDERRLLAEAGLRELRATGPPG